MTARKIKQIVLSFFIGISLLIAAIPFISETSALSEASFGFCGDLGAGMQAKAPISTDKLTAGKAGNRKWTVQELFSESIGFTSYNGSGDETWYFAKTGDDGKGIPGFDDPKVKDKTKKIRNIERCATGGMQVFASNAMISLASGVVGIAQSFVTTLFSGNIICTDGQSGNCINLLGVIGGQGRSGGGIIGSLRDSIFAPLATLAFIFTGMWVAYKGLIKREFRASLMGILWSVGIFVAGVIALNNPVLLAGAPQKVNSVLSTCIVGAMNGQSCLSGSVSAPSTLVGDECKSEAATKGGEGASMAANGMTCSIWKSFVLDAWSRAEFGESYNNLYIANPPKDGKVWKHAPKNAADYRVNLKSSGSGESYANGTVETNSVPVSNLALYQLYISTNMKSAGDSRWNDKAKDVRWFNIIVPATKDVNMWNHWAPATGYGLKRAGTAFSSLIVATAVSISLVIFAFWGLVYMFAGTLLMTFAPFFLLVAIDPGKGRRIFLGWLESVISSILKYMASSLFVIIALSLYSSILSATTNYVQAFIGVMIMVGVLGLYRKEIVNLLGMTSLGGQRLSNAVGEKLSEKGKQAKDFGEVLGGSAVGGALAANTMSDNKGFGRMKDIAKGAAQGTAQGAARQMKRGNDFTGGLARQYGASKRKIQKDLEDQKKQEETNENDGTMPNSNDKGTGTGTPNSGGKNLGTESKGAPVDLPKGDTNAPEATNSSESTRNEGGTAGAAGAGSAAGAAAGMAAGAGMSQGEATNTGGTSTSKTNASTGTLTIIEVFDGVTGGSSKHTGAIGSAYQYMVPQYEGYTADKGEIHGTYSSNRTETVNYTSKGGVTTTPPTTPTVAGKLDVINTPGNGGGSSTATTQRGGGQGGQRGQGVQSSQGTQGSGNGAPITTGGNERKRQEVSTGDIQQTTEQRFDNMTSKAQSVQSKPSNSGGLPEVDTVSPSNSERINNRVNTQTTKTSTTGEMNYDTGGKLPDANQFTNTDKGVKEASNKARTRKDINSKAKARSNKTANVQPKETPKSGEQFNLPGLEKDK